MHGVGGLWRSNRPVSCFFSLLDLLHDGLFTGGPMAGIWIAATVCCLGITLLVFRAGRPCDVLPAAWMVQLFVLQFGMTYWTLPFRASAGPHCILRSYSFRSCS